MIRQWGYSRGHPVEKREKIVQLARIAHLQLSLVLEAQVVQGIFRGTRKQSALRCYECQGVEHFAEECPTRLRRVGQDAPGKDNPSGRSRKHSPGDKPVIEPKRGEARENRAQGNERWERRQLPPPLLAWKRCQKSHGSYCDGAGHTHGHCRQRVHRETWL